MRRNVVSQDVNPSIHSLVLCGYLHVSAIENYLKRGGNPDVLNIVGQTPLHVCGITGNYKIAHLLLSYDANPLLMDNKDYTAYDYAIMYGNEAVKALLAPLTIESIHHTTPFDKENAKEEDDLYISSSSEETSPFKGIMRAYDSPPMRKSKNIPGEMQEIIVDSDIHLEMPGLIRETSHDSIKDGL